MSAETQNLQEVPTQEMQVEFRRKQAAFATYLVHHYQGTVTTTDVRIQTLERNILGVQASINDLLGRAENRSRRRKIGHQKTALIRLRGLLERAQQERFGTDLAFQEFLAQYAAIVSIPRVLSVELRPPRLELLTEPLFGFDQKGVWHRIGSMRTSYDLIAPSVHSFTWENLDGPLDECHAPPNIGMTGYASCMGPVANSVVRDAVSRRDHVAICKLLLRYPESHGKTGIIEKWPVVPFEDLPPWYRETEFEPVPPFTI